MRLIYRFAMAFTVAACLAVATALACGPGYGEVITVRYVAPPHMEEYARGELGVVRPTFERAFLVQAYRRISGQPAVPALTKDFWELKTRPVAGRTAWSAVPEAAATDTGFVAQDRFQYIANCHDDAFGNAARTYAARAAKYGRGSPEVREWVRAQNVVFSNCTGGTAAIPDPVQPEADAAARADREYQIAAAHFYNMNFDEAAKRFRAIAANAGSPWRPYGRYLAARAVIRSATIPDLPAPRKLELLAAAEAELRAVLTDRSAAHLHASARGLIDFVAVHSRPIERLRELSAILAGSRQVSDQQIVDYRILMDRLVGNTVEFEYAELPRREQMTQGDPLSDWIVAMQGQGDAAAARAVDQWKKTHSVPWLVASLWKIPAQHADTPAVLTAAARVEPSSPAFATIAFLRVRLLAARNQRSEARALLASLPRETSAGFLPEALNLLDAMRFALADSFEELLASAPRRPLLDRGYYREKITLDKPVFDDDAGEVFTYHLPLNRLVAAARDATLPDRLRLRVANAAFSRAIMLGRLDDALSVVPVLRTSAPALSGDLDRFTSAAKPQDRHIAAVRLLLRTPGMHATVRGRENEHQYGATEPERRFEHLGGNWWCTVTAGRPANTYVGSALLRMLYGPNPVPRPSFLTAEERAMAADELQKLGALGPATTWLGKEAIAWANARPKDVEAAEALAHAVEGARWGCWNDKDPNTSRRAFQTLHRLFPKSEWARRTKYWY